MRQTAAAAIAVLMLVGVAAGPVTAAPDSTKVVVAVGDSSTVLLTANAIADEHGYSVVQAPKAGLNTSTIQALTERREEGDLTDAIAIGVTTDAVADDLENEVGFDTVHEIEPDRSDTPARVTYIGSLRQWDSSSAAYVVANDTTDQRKVAVSNVSGPVLSAELDTSDIEGVLNYLSVDDVYVTPGVSQSKRDILDQSYNVNNTVDGVALNNSLQTVAGEFAGNPTSVVVSTPEHVLKASQFRVLNNSSVLVAQDASTLGSAARTNLTGTSEAYAVGVGASTVNSETSANVTSVQSFIDLRSSLLAADYPYPVVVSEVNGSSQLNATVTNIGFASVPKVDNTTLTAKWSGVIRSSDPTGDKVGDFHIVEFSDAMDSGDSFDVSLDVEKVENGGHPILEYYATAPSGNGLLGLGSQGTGPLLNFAPSVILVILAALAFAAPVAIAAAWAFSRYTT